MPFILSDVLTQFDVAEELDGMVDVIADAVEDVDDHFASLHLQFVHSRQDRLRHGGIGLLDGRRVELNAILGHGLGESLGEVSGQSHLTVVGFAFTDEHDRPRANLARLDHHATTCI